MLWSRAGVMTPHIKCQLAEASSGGSTCWKRLQTPEKVDRSHRGIFLTLKPWSPYQTSVARDDVGTIIANAFLQMCSPFRLGLARSSLASAFWEHLSHWGWRSGSVQLCHLVRWSQYFTCANGDKRVNVRAACTSFHRNQFSHAALIVEVLLAHLIAGPWLIVIHGYIARPDYKNLPLVCNKKKNLKLLIDQHVFLRKWEQSARYVLHREGRHSSLVRRFCDSSALIYFRFFFFSSEASIINQRFEK